MRAAGRLVAGVLAAAFLYGAGGNVANYLFQSGPDKVSAELVTTAFFVLSGLTLGGFSAFCFVRIWRGGGATRPTTGRPR